MIDSPTTELNTLLILQILMRAQNLEPQKKRAAKHRAVLGADRSLFFKK